MHFYSIEKDVLFQQWWDSVIVRKSYFAFLSYLPKILLAFVIPALDSIYSRIAFWLNDMGKNLLRPTFKITRGLVIIPNGLKYLT